MQPLQFFAYSFALESMSLRKMPWSFLLVIEGKFLFTQKLLSFQNDKSCLFFRSKTVGYELVLLQPAVYPHDCHSRSFLRFLGRSKETRSSNSWFQVIQNYRLRPKSANDRPKLQSRLIPCKLHALPPFHFYCFPQKKEVNKRHYVALLFSSGANHFALLARNSNKRKLKH